MVRNVHIHLVVIQQFDKDEQQFNLKEPCAKRQENRDLSGIAKLTATFTCFESCIAVFNVDTELKTMLYDAFFPYMLRRTF
jgi:hypothetical protein